MTPNDYQVLAARTINKTLDPKTGLACMGLGIAGEAGECADLIKKHIEQGHELNFEKLVKEIGDVLWYCAGLATAIGTDLESIMEANIEKLKARYPEGFSTEASINRAEAG